MKWYFKRTLIISNLIIIKSSSPLKWIHHPSPQKNCSLYSEHIRANLMTWIVLKSPKNHHKSPKTCLSSILKETSHLKNRNLWVALISSFYISLVWSHFFQYLSTNSTRCPTEKTLKDTLHLFKTKIINTPKLPISNVKPKQVLKVYHVFYK